MDIKQERGQGNTQADYTNFVHQRCQFKMGFEIINIIYVAW